MKLEFSFAQKPKNGCVSIAVNSHYYTKTIPFALELEKKLKEVIPFSFEQKGETNLNILGGQRVKGMLSVEMDISYKISDEEALTLLKGKGFSEGFELIK